MLAVIYVTTLLLLHCNSVEATEDPDTAGSSGNLLRGVTVPQYAFAGGQATLSCSYDLRATRLYSLKWYHNGTEFYRYVPTERNTPMNIKPSHKFSVTELFRNDQRVTLSLTQLAVSASGQYRCEVIAEHPSFRTEWYRATMTVLREPLSAPVLVGVREVYEPSELIKIGCQPKRPFHGDHQPTLEWYLQGDQVGSKWVKSYGGGSLQDGGIPGLSLRLPGHQVEAAGGSMVAECRLTLGPHQLATNVTIKVRLRMVSYVDNYHASGSQKAEIHSGQPGVFLSNTLLASTVVLTSLLLTSSVLLTSIALLTSPAEALLTVLLL